MNRALRPAVLFFSVLITSFVLQAAHLPEPLIPDDSTSGSLCSEDDTDFTEYRYSEEIAYCERNVASSLKNKIYQDYGVPAECKNQYTIDHFYPLALGGDNSRKNLWPEHKAIKAVRQELENLLYQQLKDGEVTQKDALATIRQQKMNPPVNKIEDGDYCDLNLVYKY